LIWLHDCLSFAVFKMSFKNRCHCDTWYGRCKNNYLVSLNPLCPGPPHKFVGQLEHFLSQSDWSVPDKKYHFLRKIFGLGFFDRQKKTLFSYSFPCKNCIFHFVHLYWWSDHKSRHFFWSSIKGNIKKHTLR